MYYTYYLINPENNEIFYIGKGSNQRMYVHLTRALKWRETNYLNQKVNKHLYYKLLSLYDNGLEPIYSIVFTSEIEKEVLDREIEDIKKIGLDNLCNITHGGEGEKRTPETLRKMSESMIKFWQSEDGYKYKTFLSESRKGNKNPRWGIKEDEQHKKQRMSTMLSKPRWNKGLKNDSRSKGHPKGHITNNALPCRLIKDEIIFEANSIKELSKISGVPLISIERLHLGISKKNRNGWKFELIKI
jgi:hypothetical protein